jgi:hypothetical protein
VTPLLQQGKRSQVPPSWEPPAPVSGQVHGSKGDILCGRAPVRRGHLQAPGDLSLEPFRNRCRLEPAANHRTPRGSLRRQTANHQSTLPAPPIQPALPRSGLSRVKRAPLRCGGQAPDGHCGDQTITSRPLAMRGGGRLAVGLFSRLAPSGARHAGFVKMHDIDPLLGLFILPNRMT